MKYTEEQVAEHRRAWVEALRSGDYEQTSGTLKAEHYERGTVNKIVAHCCLGVACDLTVKDGVGEWDDDHCFNVPGERRHYGGLPEAVMEYYGIKSEPQVSMPNGGTLTYLNDRGMTFDQIADIIERGEIR